MRYSFPRRPGRIRQAGIALPFLAISAAMLFGFIALVVDLGRLMVVRVEVQAAADNCALAAVDELDRTQGQLTRAEATGKFAASTAPVGFQRTQAGANTLTTTVQFGRAANNNDGNLVTAASVTTANQSVNYQLVKCTVSHPGIGSFFARMISASVAGTITAVARAAGAPSQKACVFPLALERANANATSRPWGFNNNNVYRPVEPLVSVGLLGVSIVLNYQVRLVDFTVPAGTATAAGTPALMNQLGTSLCDVDMTVRTNQAAPLITAQADVDTAWGPWNTRFGVYTNNSALIPTTAAPNNGLLPDLTGWAPDPPPLLGITSLTVANENGRFQTADNNGNSYIITAAQRTVMPNSAYPNNFAPSPTAGNHKELGASGRRLVIVPVTTPPTNGNGQMRNVVDYACVWLYRPIGEDSVALVANYKLSWAVEFLGFANAADSPCRSHGIPGSSTSLGPLVPVLVQ